MFPAQKQIHAGQKFEDHWVMKTVVTDGW